MYSKVILYDYIMEHVGLPYRWGGDDAIAGFDCSGLVIEFLVSCGSFPARTDSSAQGLFDRYASSRNNTPDFGSLAFFGKSDKEISHVAFCLNETQMIEAGGGGSKTITREDAISQNAYVRVRLINNRSDLVGFVLPTYPWKG